ncbi:uncharacterized protein RHOBADRAFT_56496 [Rhodotorula graminis WP1]|uniref:Uncharacterized protein n=1 Tax=Rhodotorula graminis (strain WP1) TaxID=578459 RepID=A0A0P9EE59_RHOGW|nr:uncharacterized protein RHOBADRAFT_56496 [Rhodotorula graminis WP1]KPV71663.1 hypothetical protein RHOBADRAFT_56496 [Rhodotorula graminis WP1]
MTANYTGGGLVGHRKAKRRVRQDVTDTPAYTAVAKQAYHARPGPLLAHHSAAHHLGARRKGHPLAAPTFDFAFLRDKQDDGGLKAAPSASGTRRAGGESRWGGGESRWTTTAAPATDTAVGSTFLRRQLLADPDWVGLQSIPRPQPAFLPFSKPTPPTTSQPRLPSRLPDPHAWTRRDEVAPTILRGSSILHGDNDDVSSAGLADLPRSTPPSFLLSRTTSLDAASAAARFRTASPVGPRATRPQGSPSPPRQQTPFVFHHDDADDSFDQHAIVQQPQKPQHGQDEHEMLSFSSSTHDSAFGPRLSAQAYADQYAAHVDDDQLGAAASGLALPSPILAHSTAPSPAPPRDSPQPYGHLSHLHDPSTLHLADSLDFPLIDDGDDVLVVHERMGLGCVGLSRAQAAELVERELALRGAGVGVVPEWAWGDGEVSEGEGWEQDEGEGGTGDASGEDSAATDPPRALVGATAAAPVAAFDRASLGAVVPTIVVHPSYAAVVLDSTHPDSPTPPVPGRWRSRRDGQETGMLFAMDDLSGVMEP